MKKYSTVITVKGKTAIDMEFENDSNNMEEITKVIEIAFTRMIAGIRTGDEETEENFMTYINQTANNINNPATELLVLLSKDILEEEQVVIVTKEIDG